MPIIKTDYFAELVVEDIKLGEVKVVITKKEAIHLINILSKMLEMDLERE